MSQLLEPFARMLDDVLAPAVVRSLEAGEAQTPAWQVLEQSGFLDALVAENHGGVGLTLAEVMPLSMALGARAVPLPVAESMVARALIAAAGAVVPDGPIALAAGLAWPVSGALLAQHVLVDTGAALVLAQVDTLTPRATGIAGSCAAHLAGVPQGPGIKRPAQGLRPIAAVLRAGLIAGAGERLTTMTAAYANERTQFGKPIGRQQAVQHLLAVMAEDMIACRIAAQMGAAGGLDVSPLSAASAKITTAIAAARIANTAHAVHGAIGISAEFDLNLLTRRLHEWRLADGSEGFWSRLLGEQRLASDQPTIGWVRVALA